MLDHFHPLIFLLGGVGTAAFVLFFTMLQPRAKKRIEALEAKVNKP